MEITAEQIERQTQQINMLIATVQHLTACMGARLTREQMCERIGIHRNTLTRYLDQDRAFPRPGKDGKWLLSEVIEWEQRRH